MFYEVVDQRCDWCRPPKEPASTDHPLRAVIVRATAVSVEAPRPSATLSHFRQNATRAGHRSTVLAAASRWLRTGPRGEGSSLASLASACAVSRHLAVTGIQGEPARSGAVPPAPVMMRSAVFGR